MNRKLNKNIQVGKNRNAVLFFIFLLIFWGALMPAKARSELKKMNQQELRSVTGTGYVDFSSAGNTNTTAGNTQRIFIDAHIETYTEIDSIKLGYYPRTDFRTRKFLDPLDPQVTDNGNDTFNIKDPNSGAVVYTNRPYFHYVDPDGHDNAIPYTDDSYYLYQYVTVDPIDLLLGKITLVGGLIGSLLPSIPIGMGYIDGVQGRDNKLLANEPISSTPLENTNTLDWDINLENVRLGTSPDDPFVMDGLVILLTYDDITSPAKKLTDIIIGSNSADGMLLGDLIRETGYFNPKLAGQARNTELQLAGLIERCYELPVPMSVKRDSMFTILDTFKLAYHDPGNPRGDYPPVPEDPTSTHIHTGVFLRLGLDPASEHFGFSMIAGYNEVVASAFAASDVMLTDAIHNWWF